MAVFTFLASLNGTFAGTAGDDTFIWPGANGSIDANDTFFGGAGNDTLRLDSAVGLSFMGAAAAQWMAGIERITVNNTGAGNAITIGALAGAPEGGVLTMLGGGGNDVLDISARTAGYNGVFDAAGGNDRFLGGGGDDLFRPGTGADTFHGGAGNDTVEFTQSSLLGTQPFGDSDSLNGGLGIDTLRITGDAAPGTTLGILLLPPRLVGFEIIDLRGYAGPSLIIVEAGYAADASVTVHGGAGGDHVASAGFESESYVTLFEGGAGNDRFDNYLRQVVFRPGSGADTLSSPVGGSTVEMALADLDLADSFITDPFASGIIRFTAGGVLTQSLAYRFTGFDRLELGPAGVAITLLGLPFLSPEDRTPDHSAYLPVFGGAGKDRISAAGMSPVYIAGGGDNDTIIGSAALKVLDEIEVVADTLEGNEGNDLLLGGAGWDAISGGAGDDTIDAGAGNDIAGPSLAKVLSGGAGNDRILLGAGNDEFYFDAAETGRDTVLGGSGDDTIGFLPGGQIGDDVIAGGAGADLLEFFFYTDPLTLSAAVLDRVSGFEEIRLPRGADAILFVTDTLVESAGTTLVISSDPLGARTLMLDASAVTDIGIVIFRTDDSSIANALTADTLIGGGGADTIARDGGADLVMGGGGDDLIITSFPTAAIDPARLDGGAGIDTLRAAGPVNSAGFSFAQLTGFEIIELADDVPNAITFVAGGLPAGGGVQFRGGNDSDVLDASALNTTVHLSGRAGDDMLFGGSAGDWLDAGTGTDLVMGGAGNDTIRLDDAGADDMADGGAGLDRLVLDLDGKRFGPAALANLTGFETLEVSLDGGRLVLSQGFVAAVGSGTFTLDLVTEAGGLGATLEGAQATARLDIRGGAGNESITGGRGADVISDGAGADRLRGGLGADRLVLAADGAADRVAYGAPGEGSRDIAIAANPGVLAEADTIIGFNGAGDTGNLLELTRAGFLGIGSKTAIVSVAAGGAVDLSTGAVFLIHASNAVAGGFADRAAINAAFASRVAAGDPGQAGFIIARGPVGTDAALYYLRERDGLAGLADDDQLFLLAVLTAPGVITASEISLI